MNNSRIKNIFLLAAAISLFAVINVNDSFSDSCPYCHKTYGEPMPGDEARVYELRRKHEEECSARYGGSTSSGQSSVQTVGYKDPYQQQIKEHAQDQAESIRKRTEIMALRKQEIIRYDQQKKMTEVSSDEQKETFNKNKERLVSSLKKRSTLSIKAVPSPLRPGTYVKDKKDNDSPSFGSAGEDDLMRKAVKNSYEKTVSNAKENILKNTVDNIPGAKYARKIYEKYKKMREEMKELNLNLAQYAMKGIKDGIRVLASGDIHDGGLADEYEEGRETLFGKTLIKSRKMVKDEVGTD